MRRRRKTLGTTLKAPARTSRGSETDKNGDSAGGKGAPVDRREDTEASEEQRDHRGEGHLHTRAN